MLHGATPAKTYFAAPLHIYMFQLKVSTCAFKKKADFFVTVVFIYLLLFRDYIAAVKIRPVARKGYGSIAHKAKPNGLLARGP